MVSTLPPILRSPTSNNMANASKPIYHLPASPVILITGTSSGLGLSLARHILTHHPTHRVVATARNPATITNLLPLSTNLLILPLDVTSPPSIESALTAVLAQFGRLDVLINNAGYGLSGDTESSLLPEEHAKARAVMEANFWGVTTLTLHAMRIMREDNAAGGGQQGGVIVQVSSMGGFMGFPGNAYYHGAKFAVEGFTESVSREVRPEWNIHFTIAEPGGIDTNYATSSMSLFKPHAAYTAPDCPARKLMAYVDEPEFRKSWAKPDDVAKAIYKVLSRKKRIPTRFPLGAVAWGILREEADAVSKEFDEMKELSMSVDTIEQGQQLEQVKQWT